MSQGAITEVMAIPHLGTDWEDMVWVGTPHTAMADGTVTDGATDGAIMVGDITIGITMIGITMIGVTAAGDIGVAWSITDGLLLDNLTAFGHFGNRGLNVAHNGQFGFGGMNFARGHVGGFGAGGFHGGGFHGGHGRR
jgi:hypothetical protein